MKATTAPKSPLLITALQLGLLLFVIYYTFVGGQTAQGIYDHRWRLITLWLMSLLVGGWLLGRLVRRAKPPQTRFDKPLLWLLIAWLVATVFSVNRVYSLETLVFFVTYLFIFYISVDLARWPWLVELLFNAILATSGLVWTLGLWQLFHWYQDRAAVPLLLQSLYHSFSWLRQLTVLGNPNTLAGYITLVLPIALYKLTIVRKSLTRLLLVGWILMLMLTGLLSQSRGGLVGMLAAVGIYLVVWAWSKTPHHRPLLSRFGGERDETLRPGTAVYRLLLVGLIIGLLALLIGWVVYGRSLWDGADIRQQVITGALQTWQAHPLVGSGPGTLGEELLRRLPPGGTIWADAHNLFITLAAETGLLGAVGLIWLGWVGLKQMRFTLRLEPSGFKWRGLACMAALLGFAAHNMVDSLFKFPLIMLLVAILAGVWATDEAAEGSQTSNWTRYHRAFWLPLTGLLLVINTIIGVQGMANIQAYNLAIEATERGDWPAALVNLKQADQLAPGVPFYQRQLGVVAGYLAQTDPAYRAEAIAYYQTALRGVDTLAVDHANLACLLWANGQQAEAEQSMRRAQQLEPGQALYHLNLGYYLEMTNQDQAAEDEYAGVVAHQPDTLRDDYWRQTEHRAAALPQIIARTALLVQNDSLTLAELYFYAHEFDRAEQIYTELLAQNPTASGYLGRAKTRLAVGQLEPASTDLNKAIEADPLSTQAYVYLSQVALAQNRLTEAQQSIEAALFIEKNGDALEQAAQVAARQGDAETAANYYDAAFWVNLPAPDPNLSRYATEVARRRPLPIGYLPCVLQLYPLSHLVELTQAQAELLEDRGRYTEAGRVYRRLLAVATHFTGPEVKGEAESKSTPPEYESQIEPIMVKLRELCQAHPNACAE